MTAPKKPASKNRVIRGIVPSHNAMRFCAHVLREAQYRALQHAMVYERASGRMDQTVRELYNQSDDLRQVAQFIEEHTVPMENDPASHTCLTCGRQTCDRQPEDNDPVNCQDWKPNKADHSAGIGDMR